MWRVTRWTREAQLTCAICYESGAEQASWEVLAVADSTVCQALAVGTDGRAIPHDLMTVLRVARGMRRRQEVGASIPGGQKGGDRDGPGDAVDELLVHGNLLFRSNVIPQDRTRIASCVRV